MLLEFVLCFWGGNGGVNVLLISFVSYSMSILEVSALEVHVTV